MLSVIIPVFNEEEILEQSVLKIHNHLSQRGLPYEVLVTSNGSQDRTCEIGERLMREHPWFRFFQLPERGVGRAFVKNVTEAKGEFLVSLDIDLPAELAFIDYAHELLKHCDMVIGSKTMGDQKRALPRVLGSQFYILFAQLFFHLTVSDYAPSTKAFRRSLVLPTLPYLDPWTGYVFELCVYCRIHGRKVLQIGVDCEDQRKSRFNLLHEGWYRYRHLFQCRRLLRDKSSWLHKTKI